ncbi:MAG: dihydrolipoamide acetyltransferase family protein [Actinoallomurus sp.]
MGELKQFKLPDVGEGLTEADIIKWHVQPGDVVEVNQTILEIETAKAVVELPCPFEGTVTELLVEENTTVDVGVPIITVDVGGEAVAAPPAEPGAQEPGMAGSIAPKADPTAPAAQKRVPVLVGYGVKPGSTTRRARKTSSVRSEAAVPAPAPAPVLAPVSAPVGGAVPAANGGGARVAVLAKPPVRKLAKDLGVDLATIAGTGPQGSITRDDIHQAASAPAAPARLAPVPVRSTGQREERIPIRGVRKHTAAAMVQSAFTAPHVTETMNAAKRLRDLPDFEGVKVSPLLLVAKALLLAARRHPMINATWDDAAQEIVVKHYVHLGIAAATERGLIVPKIREAQDLSLPDLARAFGELAATARAGKASPQDLSDGTLTITNVGVFGVDAGTPILTPGESAILAFGQIRDMPWVHEGEIKIRKVTTLALSFDHRVVDGELGSAVLRDVGAMLEDPMRMLAWS